ncbi:THAP domain containing 9 [Rhinolophus ferrumequinum]|uniref:THAP domain containing 9 n=1 Tax=Rhinolophus ferrumequinum TaxID=59479 RepID=A0A7J7ZF17_RHIFE|nr:THAP domain containing 9 [Rhinolophus ferrumequinum]
MLPVSKPRPVAVRNKRTIKKREGLQLIDSLIEEKLLSEETECLLRAQFSVTRGTQSGYHQRPDTCNYGNYCLSNG